jgi:SPP1 gp7 family putative phage head morphogenesis protein
MCVPYDSGDLALVTRAVDSADWILARGFGLPIEKAAGVWTPRGFERVVARLAGLLRERAAPDTEAATRAAAGELTLDWRALTPRAREQAIARAAGAAGQITARIPSRLRATLGRAAVDLVKEVREAARTRQRLAVGVDFNAVDRRVIEHVVRTQTNFVRDEFGRRSDRLSAHAREVVASGLERGLGRGEIAREIADSVGTTLRGKSPFYWEVVAGAFTATGRSYAQISSYAEAGIDRYRILAVMDAHTTPLCRFLNGRTFSVATALDRFDAIDALEDPEQIKRALPWGREAHDRQTGERHIYVQRGDARTVVASYAPAEPSRIRARVSDAELEGIWGFPPYHGLCRSTTVAVLGARTLRDGSSHLQSERAPSGICRKSVVSFNSSVGA